MQRVLSAVLLVGLVGCGVVDSYTSSSSELEELGIDIASQDTFDAQADAVISEANADAEFEKLMQEIEADG